jgi:hypothetical protein
MHLRSWSAAVSKAVHLSAIEQAAQSDDLTVRRACHTRRLLLLHERAESGREAWTVVRKQRAEERAKAALQTGKRRVTQLGFATSDTAAYWKTFSRRVANLLQLGS